MIGPLSFREQMQIEIEKSLNDVLGVLEIVVSGHHSSRSATFIRANFFKIAPTVRIRASLDPRLVASLEGIQRLVSLHDASDAQLGLQKALIDPKWIECASFVLRLELYCLLTLKQTGSATVQALTDDWISIPGTSLYVKTGNQVCLVRVVHGLVTGTPVLNVSLSTEGLNDSLPFIALPETALIPPLAHKTLLSLSPNQRSEWVARVLSALRLLYNDAPSYSLVLDYVWLIVPIADEREGYSSSISFNGIPNAIYLSYHERLMLAETLVHEADHQWLYCITRFEKLWLIPDHLQKRVHRSPWRDDPRPIDGLLRGASAFVRAGSMWTKLAASLSKDSNVLEWIRRRAVLCNFQAIDALQTVQRDGTLSSFGQGLVKSIAKRSTEARDSLCELEDFRDLLLWAENSQRHHNVAWSARNGNLGNYSPFFCVEDYLMFETPN